LPLINKGNEPKSYLIEVTNARSPDNRALAASSDSFVRIFHTLRRNSTFELIVIGQPLRSNRVHKLRRKIRRFADRRISSRETLKLLVEEIVHTSQSNPTVGSKVVAMSIPIKAIARSLATNFGPPMLPSQPDHDEGVTFAYFEPAYSDLVQYGPTFVCNGYAFADVLAARDGDDRATSMRFIAKPRQTVPGRGSD
jgi:hypothetical protein